MKREIHKKAIEAMELCAKQYRVKFLISYKSSKGLYRNIYTEKWVVEVMGKKFFGKDFINVVVQAIKFVFKAYK